ncbi:MAG: flagellar motor protein MotB [Gemmatimonadota bacterium]
MSNDKRPIIIVKKVVKAQGHHGGAWKVAFADFMTAMMAFFLVMWIVGMDEGTKEAIEGYFQNPLGVSTGQGAPMNLIDLGAAASSPASMMPVQLVARQIEEQRYRDIGEKIRIQLEGEDGLGEIAAQVEIVMTDQGLRIELVEGDDGDTFFTSGSANLQRAASRALGLIAGELRASSAPIVVEGHTDAAQYSNNTGYNNWDLSADRANTARRAMEGAGLGRGRIAEVRGYADRQLRITGDPYDNANRRISILLPFTTEPPAVDADEVEGPPETEPLGT